jgi:hypothetical protein
MLVHQAFRFELDPSSTTRSALSSHAGASRFAYNWGLALLKGPYAFEWGELVRILGGFGRDGQVTPPA